MGNLLGCIHALSCPEGCGGDRNCKDCPIRKAVSGAFEGQRIFRAKGTFQLLVNGAYHPVPMWITASPFRYHHYSFVALILEDIAELVEAAGLVQVCSSCGKGPGGPSDIQGLGLYVREDFGPNAKQILWTKDQSESNTKEA
jgi:hypothetical protein